MSCKIALVGNPNSGKSTLFNALTNGCEYIGNWPGITVEKKIGKVRDSDNVLIDLPGIYSLGILNREDCYSEEELVSRRYLLEDSPDIILNIIDGTCIERSLYLTLQLMELDIPMIVVVNMVDEVEAMGGQINCSALGSRLGILCLPISARYGTNLDLLLKELNSQKNTVLGTLKYDPIMQNAIDALYWLIGDFVPEDSPINFYISLMLSGENYILNELDLPREVKKEAARIIDDFNSNADNLDGRAYVIIARYKLIDKLIKGIIKKQLPPIFLLDKLLTHRYLAIPIFIFVMLGIFALTFGRVPTILSSYLERLFTITLPNYSQEVLINLGATDWFARLISEGIISNVGLVVAFTPQMMILFILMSILEDSGYMARIAFITDRLLKGIGLSGKAIVPMLMGFGCTTPAVMATRTLESKQNRRIAILITPFMSCSAKIPIYLLFIEIFFKSHRTLVLFSLYLLGILVSIIYGILLHKFFIKGDSAPLILELVPYRMPKMKDMIRHTWHKLEGFIMKAGTIILAMGVAMWLMQNLTPTLGLAHNGKNSILAQIGMAISPLLSPIGLGDWRISSALLSGLAAKEAIIGGLTASFGSSLTTTLAEVLNPVSAYSFMVFTLLYPPCFSAIVVMARELKRRRWLFFSIGVHIVVAYIAALIVYKVGIILV